MKPPGVCQQHVTGVADHYSTRLYIQCLPFTLHLSLSIINVAECFAKVFLKKKVFILSLNQDQINSINYSINYQSLTGKAFVHFQPWQLQASSVSLNNGLVYSDTGLHDKKGKQKKNSIGDERLFLTELHSSCDIMHLALLKK